MPAISCLPDRGWLAHALGMPERQSEPTATDLEILGARIGRAIQEKGLSQTYVARQLGVRNATVGDWVAGRFTPRGDNLRRLAEVLGMTTDDLLDITEGKDPPFASWAAFVARNELTPDERRFLRKLEWGDGHEPSEPAYAAVLAIYRSTRRA